MSFNKRIVKMLITLAVLILFLTPTVFGANTTSKSSLISNNTKTTTVKPELEKLEIKGFKLEPSYNKETYQYKVVLEGSINKLDIIAEANQSNANVKIIGNEKLINGRNLITVIVSDAKETTASTYQIYVDKNVVDQAELNKHIDEAQLQQKIKEYIVIGLIIFIVILIIIFIRLVHKKRKSSKYNNDKDIAEDNYIEDRKKVKSIKVNKKANKIDEEDKFKKSNKHGKHGKHSK